MVIVSVDELHALLHSGSAYACLDVRERGEFAGEQIEGVTPLPRGTLEYRITTMVPGRNIPIAVLCDDGRRSALAAQMLGEMGYTDVRVLDGGLHAWRARGMPTASGWGRLGKMYGERIAADEAVPQITADDLAQLRERGEAVTVVDVRTEEEFLRGHVPGAFHIPGGQLLLEVPALPRDHQLVISCAGRTRGILGAYLLRQAGFTNVTALLNGAMGWRLIGRDLEEGIGAGRLRAKSPTSEAVREATRLLARDAGIRHISVADFDRLRATGEPHYAIDVRVPEDFRAGHVPGAIPLPAGQFALQHENFLAVRRLPVVVLANDDVSPIWAAVQCQALDFPNTFVLESGIGAWAAAGGTLEMGSAAVEAYGLDAARRDVQGIGPAEARAPQEAGTVLLDVRSSGEFAMGHIPGSRWLARGKLELDAPRVIPDQAVALVVVCDNGVRSALAAATLGRMGYGRVTYLEGGLAAWRSDGGVVVDGLEGADVSREEAQNDFGSTLWSGALGRTREDMVQYLTWEEALAHR